METRPLTPTDIEILTQMRGDNKFRALWITCLLALVAMPSCVLFPREGSHYREAWLVAMLVFFGIFVITTILTIKQWVLRSKVNREIRGGVKQVCTESFTMVKQIGHASRRTQNTWKTWSTYVMQGNLSGKKIEVSQNHYDRMKTMPRVCIQVTPVHHFILDLQEAKKIQVEKTAAEKRKELELWHQQFNDAVAARGFKAAEHEIGVPPPLE